MPERRIIQMGAQPRIGRWCGNLRGGYAALLTILAIRGQGGPSGLSSFFVKARH